ncbi:hypothetical protein [Tateyamaria sp.]|uniref:hypothetical protein n=1 Tax=Tateyamaria sp. TaxID=1929288 RepID=UPI00329F5777
MLFCRLAFVLFVAGSLPFAALAQSAETAAPRLHLELNNLQDIEGTCRLSFLAKNETTTPIEKAVFETVIFDASGGVASLSLFDFRDLPIDRARVRQFDLPGRSCDSIGQALINGANSCVVAGTESAICKDTLFLSSRLEIELIG